MDDRWRRRIPQIAAVVVGLLLILWLRRPGPETNPPSDPNSSPVLTNCLHLAVTASSEKAALLTQIAEGFNRTGAQVDGQCVAVDVTSKSSGSAMDALARGWDEGLDGPRPDVWTPASSTWVGLLQQRLTAHDSPDLVPEDVPHIAYSPLVIAMPKPMAEVLGWPQKQLGWSDIFKLANDPDGWGSYGHPEWGSFKLGKTNPNYSTSGPQLPDRDLFRGHRSHERPLAPHDQAAEGPGLRARRRVGRRALRRYLADVPVQPATSR